MLSKWPSFVTVNVLPTIKIILGGGRCRPIEGSTMIHPTNAAALNCGSYTPIVGLVTKKIREQQCLSSLCRGDFHVANLRSSSGMRFLHQGMFSGLKPLKHHGETNVRWNSIIDSIYIVVVQNFPVIRLCPRHRKFIDNRLPAHIIAIGDGQSFHACQWMTVLARLITGKTSPNDPQSDRIKPTFHYRFTPVSHDW